MNIDPYSTLIKTTDNSNKIYLIYVEHLNKGDLLNTEPPKITNKECYQVYVQYGKIKGTLRTHYFKSFFSLTAANRFAKRLHESKLQKKYILKSNEKTEDPTSETLTKINSKKNSNYLKKEKIFPLFDKLPQRKPKMSINQKARFLEIID